MNEQGWVPLTLIAGFKKVRLHAQLDQLFSLLRDVTILLLNSRKIFISCFQVFSKTSDIEFILDSILPSTEVEVLVGFLAKSF